MLYFPQFLPGAVAQYPLSRQRIFRTVRAVNLSGGIAKRADSEAGRVRWELTYRRLTEEERDTLEQFFEATEGRLKNFTFVDPTANLLAWSERLSEPVWTKDPLLTLTEGQVDPEGGQTATRVTNTGAAPQELSQAIAAPGWYQYCFSAYVRGDGGGVLELVRAAAGGEDRRGFAVTPEWRRVWLTGRTTTTAETVRFAIRLAGGMATDLWGLQVEAQVLPSTYKRSSARGGVFPTARFDSDALAIQADGPGQYSCTVFITAPLSG
ncbi:MAG: hypothetical protein RMK57_16245 [Bryobacterales bacterium]|nr:hypothetical protein [Bryobacteraceae bacterium]MDW8356074.1 hypothetical protein [Bryobacterales bacterium]